MSKTAAKGWDASADAWIRDMGEHGDFGRRCVLDPVMRARIEGRGFQRALDVGCGEGRFCRILRRLHVDPIGVDPTERLLQAARERDPGGDYRLGRGEAPPLDDQSVDLVVSYLTLIDIEDAETAITEMARVLQPGGVLLIANLTSFNTSGAETGWRRDENGALLHFPVDHYLEPREIHSPWRGISVANHHRPLSFYMRALLGTGLTLTHFDEPRASYATPEEAARAARYDRAPWFLVMEWRKP